MEVFFLTTLPTKKVSTTPAKKKAEPSVPSVFLDVEKLNLVVERKIPGEYEGSVRIETKIYSLIPATADEIFSLRTNGACCFVLKKENSYFYTEIPRELCCISNSILGVHKCVHCSHFFSSNSSCPKAKLPSFSWYVRRKPYPTDDLEQFYLSLLDDSYRIEGLSFIVSGYETFNCPSESFVVSKCSNFVNFDHPKPAKKTTKPHYY